VLIDFQLIYSLKIQKKHFLPIISFFTKWHENNVLATNISLHDIQAIPCEFVFFSNSYRMLNIVDAYFLFKRKTLSLVH